MTVVVAIELLIAGALVLAYDNGPLWWTALIAAVLLSAMLVSPPGRTSVARLSMLRFGLWRRRLLRGSEPDGSRPDQAPFDIPVPDETPIGARWDGTSLITVLRIDTPPPTIALLNPGVPTTGIAGIPLTALAESVRQFDIELESIDVISHGIRSHGAGRVAQVYLRTLGPLPATAYRSVLVVLRLDPSRCPEAVARRGGGSEGALRTALVATRRVANRIGGRGLSTTALTGAEITAATTQLAHGAGGGEVSERWESVSVGRLQMSTFAVSPEHLARTLDEVWAVPSVSTTVTTRLRPTAEGEISLRTLVRFNTIITEHTPISGPPIEGLIPLHGRQRAALAASLPVGPADRLPPISEHAVAADDLTRVFLAAAGCGQLIGADHNGRAVAVDLLGGRPHRISIAGGLHLAQQVLLRAIGVGARVLIYSDRPADWQQFVTAVGDPGLVALAGGRVFPGHFTVAMFDGLTPATVDTPTTVILVPPGTHTEPADIRLVQNHAAPQDIWISTPGGSAMVTMVATGDEISFIGSSLPSTNAARASGGPAPERDAAVGAAPDY
ncbi:UNVERIFIED_CONTAM: type VII secretion protein EccE [Williamsia faeni]